jgi:dihydrofolate reductase
MNLILAADQNWAIGYKGGLLCHIPGDLKFFKEQTTGSTVVMGRATLESLPGGKGLPGRTNIVLTGNKDFAAERVQTVVHSMEELTEELKKHENVFVIGGESVYKALLPQCDTCYITRMYAAFPADRYFVDLDADEDFQVTWQSDMKEENGVKYRFFKYERKH